MKEALTWRARMILGMIRRHGAVSRATLMRDTGLSGTAVFRATEELAAAGLVQIGDTVAAGRGAPSATVHIVPDAAFSLGLSVMTDRADIILVDLAGRIRARQELTRPGMPLDAILSGAETFGEQALADAGADRDRLCGIGAAVAGYFVEPDILNPADEIAEWGLVDLRETLGQRLGMACQVENIASAAAVGERLLGAGAGFDSFCYVNIAAGFGAGLVLNGQLWRGRHGNAGEIAGLFPLSGRATPNLTDLRLTLSQHGIATDSIADLVTRFDPAWPGVAAWLTTHRADFYYFFNAVRFMLDCEAIIIGGRIPRPLAQAIVTGVHWPEESLPARRGRRAPATRLVVADLEPEWSAPLGAASLLFQKTLFG
jgi:predicted NBD/HSP70 family sugar kinase